MPAALREPAPFVFGLTGGVASGKSSAARYFAQRGVEVIDADELAREVVMPGSDALREIEAAFGAVTADDGTLDRAALASIVFSDPQALATLNAITHPRVAALFRQRLSTLQAQGRDPLLVCYEVPLLFENGLHTWLRPVVVVACDPKLQLERAIARNGWTPTHAQQRIDAQMPLHEKRVRADLVIENDGSLADLERRCEEVLQRLLVMARAGSAPSDALA